MLNPSSSPPPRVNVDPSTPVEYSASTICVSRPRFAQNINCSGNIFTYGNFYPSPDVPKGSLLAMINLDTLYFYIHSVWTEDMFKAYQSFIARGEIKGAWEYLKASAEEMLLHKMPICHHRGGNDQKIVSRLIETFTNSPMINTPLKSLQEITTMLSRQIAALDSSIADNLERNVQNQGELPVPFPAPPPIPPLMPMPRPEGIIRPPIQPSPTRKFTGF